MSQRHRWKKRDLSVRFHGGNAELIKLSKSDWLFPSQMGSLTMFTVQACSCGTKDPGRILCEFHRVLKPGGYGRLMVYNYNSIWLHLYVAYMLRKTNPSLAGHSHS